MKDPSQSLERVARAVAPFVPFLRGGGTVKLAGAATRPLRAVRLWGDANRPRVILVSGIETAP